MSERSEPVFSFKRVVARRVLSSVCGVSYVAYACLIACCGDMWHRGHRATLVVVCPPGSSYVVHAAYHVYRHSACGNLEQPLRLAHGLRLGWRAVCAWTFAPSPLPAHYKLLSSVGPAVLSHSTSMHELESKLVSPPCVKFALPFYCCSCCGRVPKPYHVFSISPVFARCCLVPLHARSLPRSHAPSVLRSLAHSLTPTLPHSLTRSLTHSIKPV